MSPGRWVLVAVLGAFPALAAPTAKQPEEPIRILHADRFPMDRTQEVVILEGHVRVSRGKAILSGEYLEWKRKQEVIEIRGDVAITDESIRLDADELLYDLSDESLTAWGSPRILQLPESGEGFQTELKAVQLRLFPREGRIEALENVEVTQSKVVPGEDGAPDRTVPEMKVTCRVAEVLARGKRNVFKGDVAVETSDIGARAGRVLYEKESRRVYLLDGATVWNYDSQGKRLDELRGDKVIHFLDGGRTVALGGVRALVHPEAKPAGTPQPAGAGARAQKGRSP